MHDPAQTGGADRQTIDLKNPEQTFAGQASFGGRPDRRAALPESLPEKLLAAETPRRTERRVRYCSTMHGLVRTAQRKYTSTIMAERKKSRRYYLSLQALDPATGKLDAEVQISYDRMQAVGRRSLGHAKECGYIVPAILQRPKAVFEGLRRDPRRLSTPIQKAAAMTITSNDEFAKRMMLLAGPAEQFRATAIYDPDGDCIEFLAKPDPFYAERVDDLVTVYYSQDTGEVVGSLLKGVSTFCRQMLEKMPGFRVEIHDGRVRLVHIFRARLWSSEFDPQAIPALVYRKLIEVADEAEVEADLRVA